jgi:hypothetical protein
MLLEILPLNISPHTSQLNDPEIFVLDSFDLFPASPLLDFRLNSSFSISFVCTYVYVSVCTGTFDVVTFSFPLDMIQCNTTNYFRILILISTQGNDVTKLDLRTLPRKPIPRGSATKCVP